MNRIGVDAPPSTVIIADSVFFVRENLRIILEMSGCVVVAEAEDGVEAVLTFQEFRPDIIFLDVNLPFKSGLDALKEIISHTSRAKVVMCCTGAHRALAQAAVASGASDLLVKPYQPKEIRRVLLNLTGEGDLFSPRPLSGSTDHPTMEKV